MNLHDLYEKSNHAAFCFGRLNPPTLGHKQLLDTVARAGQGSYYIFLSQTQKLPDNPLSYEEKVKFVRAMFPEHSEHVITGPGLNTIMKVAAWVYNQGVRSVSFVAGSDRLEDFKALLDKYNGYGEPGQEGYYKFDSINYVSSGERDPDAEGVAGYSASKARAAVIANDFETFKQVTGAGKLAKQLYDAVKAALEAAPVKKPGAKKPKVAKEAADIEQGVEEGLKSKAAAAALAGTMASPQAHSISVPAFNMAPAVYQTQIKPKQDQEASRKAGRAFPLSQQSKELMKKKDVDETIRKVKGGYRLVSHKGKNLGTYPTHAGAERREQQVNYFKHVKEDVDSDSNIKDLFAKFLPLAAEYLGLEKLPKINLELTLPAQNGQASFGGYNSNTKEITLAIANRHPVDIFRTLAHELVHFKQDTLGKLKEYSGETGSTEENQANTVSGIIMRLFNKAYPDAMNAKVISSDSQEIEEDIVDDTVQYHDTLEPTVWQAGVLKPEIRNRLLTIAKQFIDSLNVDNFDAKDIVLTGSMANYNYTKFSDFDLHVITDYDSLECSKIANEFYQSKKRIWNRDYDIQINGHDVELYVEDNDDPPVSGGVYSILDDKWIKEPTHENPEVDLRAVRAKTREYIKTIHDALNGHLDAEANSRLVKKLRDMRTSGLEQGGEFSVENLAYKTLRNAGVLDKLSDLRRHQTTTDLSL